MKLFHVRDVRAFLQASFGFQKIRADKDRLPRKVNSHRCLAPFRRVLGLRRPCAQSVSIHKAESTSRTP